MGEFQCYQFRSFERPLTKEEREEVQSFSSRAEVSSHAATFVYHYGDFRKDPEMVVAEYFDAMLYFANWATRRLIFRLPAAELDVAAVQQFCLESKWSSDYISLTKMKGIYLLDIHFNDEEGGGWMNEDDFDLGEIGKLRDDILAGDYRALYLIWAQFSRPEEDEEEGSTKETAHNDNPPVPANFKKLTSALTAFTNFFEIDSDLIAAIQSVSATQATSPPDYEKLLQQLPPAEHLEWLTLLLNDDPRRLGTLLKKRLNNLLPATELPAGPVVSPAQLWALASEQEEIRQAEAAKEVEAAHIKKMEKRASEEAQMWKTVHYNLLRKTSKSQQIAIDTLTELRDLAIYQDKLDDFQAKMTALREEYARSRSLLAKWDGVGL